MSNFASALCVAMVDEWIRCGVSRAIIAPGSRSTPLALALTARPELVCEVVLDERSAAFIALGVGVSSGVPAIVLTTSGTATTHLHAAVVEADLSGVPLLACTADRPPELYGVGAAQTIDQRHLFGRASRGYFDLGVPDAENRPAWRSLACQAFAAATGVPAGPVQVNLCFREPLVGPPATVPPGRSGGRPWHRRIVHRPGAPDEAVRRMASDWPARRGVLLAGAGIDDPQAVLDLGARLGWPVLAEPRSGCRQEQPTVIAHADAILRSPRAAAVLQPELVVSFGALPASKVVANWIATTTSHDRDGVRIVPQAADGPGTPRGMPDVRGAAAAEWVQINHAGTWSDPDRRASILVQSAPSEFIRTLFEMWGADGGGTEEGARFIGGRIDVESTVGEPGRSVGSRPRWVRDWRLADDAAALAIDDVLLDEARKLPRPTEPAVARSVLAAAQRHDVASLVVSSSMPVRDLEWFAPRFPSGATALRVLANRGANGIDGVVSTALGVAMALRPDPVWVLLGDLAFLHDATALLNLAERDVTLRIVVVDNGGGGIFSFLPQATAVPAERFEQLFGTPQQVDLPGVLAAHRVAVDAVQDVTDLDAGLDRLARRPESVAALVIRAVDREQNSAVHGRINAAVVDAVSAALADDDRWVDGAADRPPAQR